MRKIKQIIFWLSILYLICWIAYPVIRQMLDLEYASAAYESSYLSFQIIAIPITLCLLILSTIDKSSINGLIAKIIAAIVIPFATMYMIILCNWNLCNWSNGKELYIHRSDKNKKIIVRSFGCGAVDSTEPIIKTFIVENYSKYFIKTTEIDTAKINDDQWLKVE